MTLLLILAALAGAAIAVCGLLYSIFGGMSSDGVLADKLARRGGMVMLAGVVVCIAATVTLIVRAFI